jgi:hypothetical protein
MDMTEDEDVLAKIDAMAEELRQRLQGGKQLTPWQKTPNYAKKKWLEHARALYETSMKTHAAK